MNNNLKNCLIYNKIIIIHRENKKSWKKWNIG